MYIENIKILNAFPIEIFVRVFFFTKLNQLFKKSCQKHVTNCHSIYFQYSFNLKLLLFLRYLYFFFLNMEAKKVRKHPFTVEEDRALLNYIMIYGPSNWMQIASLMNGRTQKQCRERWTGHLCPSVNKGPWTLEEDMILAQKHSEIGNKWARIATFLPGRTDILVKNRWNTSVKKRVEDGTLTLHAPSPPSSPAQTNPEHKPNFTIPSILQSVEPFDFEKWLNFMTSRRSLSFGPPSILVNQPANY